MAEAKNDPAEGTPSPPSEAARPAAKGLRKESIWEVYYPRDVRGEADAIPLASFPMIIYFWPSIVAYLFCGVCSQFGWFAKTKR